MDERNQDDIISQATADKNEPSIEAVIDRKSFTSRDLTTLLDIAPSTLRKYSTALESAGYSIARNAQKQRLYTEIDVITLRNLKELVDAGILVDKAAGIIQAGEKSVGGNSNMPAEMAPILSLEITEKLNEMAEYFIRQEENTERLIKEIKSDRKIAEQNAELVAKELAEMKALNYKLIEKLEAREEAEFVNKIDEVSKKKKWWQR